MRFALLLLASAATYAETIFIQNATVYTVTKGTFKGSVLIEDGKIKQVGQNLAAPSGARIVDAAGMHLSPGIIDAHSHIAAGAGGINEGSVSVSSMVRIEDFVDPESVAIYRALAGGVTSANILHGSANAIGGQNRLIKMRWGKTGVEMLFDGGPPSIKFALGENPKRSGNPTPAPGGPTTVARYPATRMGVEDIYRQAFTEAKEYQKAWVDFKSGKSTVEPRRDLRLEPLVEIMEGKRLVHCHAYRGDEMLMMMRVAEEFGFRIATFQHVQEGYKIAKEMVEHGVGGSGFSDWWAYKMEVVDGIPYNMALMTSKGVMAAVNSDDAGLMRRLNTEAAKTMKYGGLTEDQALALITINPARHMKVDDRIGSIEVGKDADLVIWNKPPLSSYAVPQKVYIDGSLYFDRDTDVSSRIAKEARKKALEEKAKAQQIPPQPKKDSAPQGGPQSDEVR